jgi:hypothetical protein
VPFFSVSAGGQDLKYKYTLRWTAAFPEGLHQTTDIPCDLSIKAKLDFLLPRLEVGH